MPNLTCSRCRSSWQEPAVQPGGEVRCPKCGATFRIGAPAAVAPPIAPQPLVAEVAWAAPAASPGISVVSSRKVRKKGSNAYGVAAVGLVLLAAFLGGLLWWFDPFTDPHVKLIKERLAFQDRLNGIL